MEDQQFQFAVTLTEVNCGECGGTYAINERFRQQKEDKGGYWTCPYCKAGWGYGTSEIDKLKKKLEQERKRKEWAKQDAKNLRKSLTAQKAATTRLRNRSKAGLCPCCNRHFKQLSAHMKNKHPNFDPKKD